MIRRLVCALAFLSRAPLPARLVFDARDVGRATLMFPVIVAHGGTVRTLLAEALGLADAHIFRLDVAHASYHIIDWFADGTPVVRLMNATAVGD
jgi:broad specificity phosphatase PhoE